MKYTEAIEEIKALWPLNTALFFDFKCKAISGYPAIMDIDIWVNAIPPWTDPNKLKTNLFCAPTWQGIIDKMKIHLLPKGESNINEAIEEAALKASASTAGQQPAGLNVNESLDNGAVATSPDLASD